MYLIEKNNYDYISTKYHKLSKNWDGHQRFVRQDEIFSPNTGASPEEIIDGILKQDKMYEEKAQPIRKAYALSYVLKNTRISCDARDIFPAINMIDRPLKRTLISKWEKEIFDKYIPKVMAKRNQLEEDGITTIWVDYDHSVPVWESVLGLGFSGILKESENARKSRALTDEQDDFFEGIRITYEGILLFINRLYLLANETTGSEKMARALKIICKNPPRTFYEALLVVYIYFMISEHIDCLQVRSLSNFDRLFFEFYKNDIRNGKTEIELRTELAYFLIQFSAIGNYWNQPVFLGGDDEEGKTIINELSFVFLDVYDKMGIYNPKIQIKASKTTPKPFLLKALDMIRRGHNSIVFVNDEAIRKSLTRAGAKEDEARLCNITGCYEYSVQGAYHTGMNYLNLLKPLEYALHGGCDGLTGKPSGLKCSPCSEYKGFNELYDEYKRQLKNVIETTLEVTNAIEGYLCEINPLSMLSATFPSCLKTGRDALGGGAKNNDTIMNFGYIADIADSLSILQRYVFEKRELSLSKFVEILDRNYEGNEKLRMRIWQDGEKYGNNKERPDAFATDIIEFIVSTVNGRLNSSKRGGRWSCGFHVARMSYTQGEKTAASPNGRRLGDELSKNISPSMGQGREGATATILSATKI